jgi:parvulin-like peptidyl-prolyl isomerase
MSLLDSGADFESVCKRYSKSPDASEGGQVLTVVYGKYHPEIQQILFKIDVGEYTPPVFTAYGYFICKVLRRTEGRAPEPFETMRPQLEKEVRAIKEVLATNRYTENLRKEYGVEWYWDNMRICFEALPPDRDFDKAPSRKDEVYPLLYFDPDDLEKPVVSYGEKTLLVKDFSDYYDQASFYARPRRTYRVAGVKTFLTERLMTDIIQREMTRSKIAEDPEVAAVIKAKREEMMISRLWDDMINSQTTVSDKAIREYYETHKSDFVLPERRRFGVILTGNVEDAQKAYDELKSGTLFRTVAMAYSIDETTKKTLGETELLTKGEQPELDEVGFSLAGVGSVSEPFQTSRGWMILKVTELEEAGQYTEQQARPGIEKALKEELNDARLQELLAKWKEELNVKIHEDNLKKVQIEERTAEARAQA